MKQILINIMCSANYPSIKHEIINFFKTDEGEEYIYTLSYGGIEEERNDKIEYILLTSEYHDGRVEVLAKAKVIEQIHKLGDKGSIEGHDLQLKEIKKRNITYGYLPVNKNFTDNEDNDKAIYVTFKVESIIKPKVKLYISNNEDDNDKENIIVLDKNISKESLKTYIEEKSDESDYDKIMDIIIDKESKYWEDTDSTSKVPMDKYKNIEEDISFLQLIEKEDDEVIFTNMIWYWFSRKNMFNKFISSYLGEEDQYVLEKEKVTTNRRGRMDIYATGNEYVVIIENKINSSFNGVDEDNKIMQMNTYFEDSLNR